MRKIEKKTDTAFIDVETVLWAKINWALSSLRFWIITGSVLIHTGWQIFKRYLLNRYIKLACRSKSFE